MRKFRVMPIAQRWLSQYPYASAVLGTLAIVTLLVSTNGFAGVRQAIQDVRQQAEERQLAREARRYVWCYSRYGNDEQRTEIYGHFPGYHTEDVLRFYDAPTWLLTMDLQDRTCYRTWQQAGEATEAFAAGHPAILLGTWTLPDRNADEDTWRLTVLTAILDQPAKSHRVQTALPNAGTPEQWCISRLRTAEHTLYDVPHQAGGREAVEAVLNQLPDRSHLARYRLDATTCFSADADAVGWLTQNGFVAPAGSTVATYVDAVTAWLGEG